MRVGNNAPFFTLVNNIIRAVYCYTAFGRARDALSLNFLKNIWLEKPIHINVLNSRIKNQGTACSHYVIILQLHNKNF
jgi:hypothetical protein